MITVAVATRDSAASRYYRGLFADAKFEAIFAPDVESLIRSVKSRPVDIVIFDLTLPSIPVTPWLEAVARDSDLALTPVLWVGQAHPMALTTTLDNYRPGARIREKPTLKVLMEQVHQMVGRLAQPARPVVGVSSSASRAWKPEGETIDDALSIFAESPGMGGRYRTVHGTGKTLTGGPEEDQRQTTEIRPRTVNHQPRPVSGNMQAALPDALTPPPDAGAKERSIRDSSLTSFSEEYVDEVTSRVISRLAVEVFKNLDTNVVRQAVRDVLAETEK